VAHFDPRRVRLRLLALLAAFFAPFISSSFRRASRAALPSRLCRGARLRCYRVPQAAAARRSGGTAGHDPSCNPRYNVDKETRQVQPANRLGPYEIVPPIGAGGMGDVYRAQQEPEVA